MARGGVWQVRKLRKELQETREYVYARVMKWPARRDLLREANASNEAPSYSAGAQFPYERTGLGETAELGVMSPPSPELPRLHELPAQLQTKGLLPAMSARGVRSTVSRSCCTTYRFRT